MNICRVCGVLSSLDGWLARLLACAEDLDGPRRRGALATRAVLPGLLGGNGKRNISLPPGNTRGRGLGDGGEVARSERYVVCQSCRNHDDPELTRSVQMLRMEGDVFCCEPVIAPLWPGGHRASVRCDVWQR
jgi:hypothetical protein